MVNTGISWQSNTTSIKDKLLHLMESKEMSDVTFVVGSEKKSFSVHSWLLSSYSEVFHAMLYGPMADKSHTISLPEDDAKDFHIFSEYVYTDTVKINSIDEAISLLYFSEKYMVSEIKKNCLTYLKNNITLNSAFKIYENSSKLEIDELKEKSWNYIVTNATQVIKQDIGGVSFETMLKITSEDNLCLEKEVDMYNAIMNWGMENFVDESVFEKLRQLVNEVRFLSMTPTEFAGGPCKFGILTKDEKLEIFKEFATGKKNENAIVKESWRKPRKIHHDALHGSRIRKF